MTIPRPRVPIILFMPALTAIEVVHDYAEPPLELELEARGFSVSGALSGKERLLESDLASALQGDPVGPQKRGPKPKAERLARFDALAAIASTNDVALNGTLGRALRDCGLIPEFATEVDLGGGLSRKSDLVCNPTRGVRQGLQGRAPAG